MKFEFDDQEKSLTIRAPRKWTVSESVRVFNELQQHLDIIQNVTINISKTKEFDTSALQLMALLDRYESSSNLTLKLEGANEVLQQTMLLCGFDELANEILPQEEKVAC